MKPSLTCLLLAGLLVSAHTSTFGQKAPAKKVPAAKVKPSDLEELAVGDEAPDFDLIGIDDKQHTLAEYADAEVLVIAFLSNHCPTSQGIEGRLKQFVADYRSKGVQVVAINPNDPGALRPDELGYSKYNDSFPEMKLHAAEQGFEFPYLFDGDTHAVAKAYGCLATPHIFVFDADRQLRYKGRFDDSRYADPTTVTSHDAIDAVEAVLAGKEVQVTETRPHGCSTKWKDKRPLVTEDDQKWATGTVDVELIDADGVANLRKNDTDKYRMFNVWATWCGPCVEEFPELVKTSRKFGLRNFEFISISEDDPSTLDQVKAFLEENNAIIPAKVWRTVEAEGRKTNSYVYNGANLDALAEALDTEWKGPIPHTLVVAPGGKVIFRHNGIVDGEELRATILEHMGRFYLPEK
jgi:thiol-disulfide isomerase/thioredoxin